MTNRSDHPASPPVRPAAKTDRAQIARLLRELHPGQTDAITLPRVRQQAETFVATNGDDVIGLAVATLVDYGLASYGTVEELAVDASHRGNGTGTALLRRCCDWLTTSGAEVVFVSALDDDAARFYLESGFTRCTGPWLFRAVNNAEPPGLLH